MARVSCRGAKFFHQLPRLKSSRARYPLRLIELVLLFKPFYFCTKKISGKIFPTEICKFFIRKTSVKIRTCQNCGKINNGVETKKLLKKNCWCFSINLWIFNKYSMNIFHYRHSESWKGCPKKFALCHVNVLSKWKFVEALKSIFKCDY